MKRILPAGERYGLFSNTPNFSNSQKFLRYNRTVIWFSLCFLLISLSSFQNLTSPEEPIRVYHIGEKVNKDFVIGYDPMDTTRKYTLSDFKGKAIILDVWWPGCSTCIAKFPAMDSISRQYDSELIVLLVGLTKWYSLAHYRDFIKKYNETNKQLQLKFILDEGSLDDVFLIDGVPHYVWIDPNRRLRANTSFEQLNVFNINRLLAGLPLNIPMKYYNGYKKKMIEKDRVKFK